MYSLEFSRSARKEINKLPPQIAQRIAAGINKLRRNPRTGSVRQMVGGKSWRLRVGDYRIIYDISDQKLTILILKVGHRRNIYNR